MGGGSTNLMGAIFIVIRYTLNWFIVLFKHLTDRFYRKDLTECQRQTKDWSPGISALHAKALAQRPDKGQTDKTFKV